MDCWLNQTCKIVVDHFYVQVPNCNLLIGSPFTLFDPWPLRQNIHVILATGELCLGPFQISNSINNNMIVSQG